MAAAKRSREALPPPPDRLEAIRDRMRAARDLRLKIAGDIEKTKQDMAALYAIEHGELPELFSQVQQNYLQLGAEGNLPAYDGRLKPYYKAVIAADWPEERRERGFAEVERLGGEDLIKNQIIIETGRGEEKIAAKVVAGLEKAGVAFKRKRDVPWNTLTAFVKEQVEEKKVVPNLELLGAVVGRVVELKPEKAK